MGTVSCDAKLCVAYLWSEHLINNNSIKGGNAVGKCVTWKIKVATAAFSCARHTELRTVAGSLPSSLWGRCLTNTELHCCNELFNLDKNDFQIITFFFQTNNNKKTNWTDLQCRIQTEFRRLRRKHCRLDLRGRNEKCNPEAEQTFLYPLFASDLPAVQGAAPSLGFAIPADHVFCIFLT